MLGLDLRYLPDRYQAQSGGKDREDSMQARLPSHSKIKAPLPTDRHVGGRIRMRRMMLDMSQEKLGRALGLTFQQVQDRKSVV